MLDLARGLSVLDRILKLGIDSAPQRQLNALNDVLSREDVKNKQSNLLSLDLSIRHLPQDQLLAMDLLKYNHRAQNVAVLVEDPLIVIRYLDKQLNKAVDVLRNLKF